MHGMNTPAVASPRWGDATAGVGNKGSDHWANAISPMITSYYCKPSYCLMLKGCTCCARHSYYPKDHHACGRDRPMGVLSLLPNTSYLYTAWLLVARPEGVMRLASGIKGLED